MLTLSVPAHTGSPVGDPATTSIERPPADEKSAATTEPLARVMTGGATTVRVFIATRPLESTTGLRPSTPRIAVIDPTAPAEGTRQVCAAGVSDSTNL